MPTIPLPNASGIAAIERYREQSAQSNGAPVKFKHFESVSSSSDEEDEATSPPLPPVQPQEELPKPTQESNSATEETNKVKEENTEEIKKEDGEVEQVISEAKPEEAQPKNDLNDIEVITRAPGCLAISATIEGQRYTGVLFATGDVPGNEKNSTEPSGNIHQLLSNEENRKFVDFCKKDDSTVTLDQWASLLVDRRIVPGRIEKRQKPPRANWAQMGKRMICYSCLCIVPEEESYTMPFACKCREKARQRALASQRRLGGYLKNDGGVERGHDSAPKNEATFLQPQQKDSALSGGIAMGKDWRQQPPLQQPTSSQAAQQPQPKVVPLPKIPNCGGNLKVKQQQQFQHKRLLPPPMLSTTGRIPQIPSSKPNYIGKKMLQNWAPKKPSLVHVRVSPQASGVYKTQTRGQANRQTSFVLPVGYKTKQQQKQIPANKVQNYERLNPIIIKSSPPNQQNLGLKIQTTTSSEGNRRRGSSQSEMVSPTAWCVQKNEKNPLQMTFMKSAAQGAEVIGDGNSTSIPTIEEAMSIDQQIGLQPPESLLTPPPSQSESKPLSVASLLPPPMKSATATAFVASDGPIARLIFERKASVSSQQSHSSSISSNRPGIEASIKRIVDNATGKVGGGISSHQKTVPVPHQNPSQPHQESGSYFEKFQSLLHQKIHHTDDISSSTGFPVLPAFPSSEFSVNKLVSEGAKKKSSLVLLKKAPRATILRPSNSQQQLNREDNNNLTATTKGVAENDVKLMSPSTSSSAGTNNISSVMGKQKPIATATVSSPFSKRPSIIVPVQKRSRQSIGTTEQPNQKKTRPSEDVVENGGGENPRSARKPREKATENESLNSKDFAKDMDVKLEKKEEEEDEILPTPIWKENFPFQKGQVVWAKGRGLPFWPGTVIDFLPESVLISWCGEKTYSEVPPEKVENFLDQLTHRFPHRILKPNIKKLCMAVADAVVEGGYSEAELKGKVTPALASALATKHGMILDPSTEMVVEEKKAAQNLKSPKGRPIKKRDTTATEDASLPIPVNKDEVVDGEAETSAKGENQQQPVEEEVLVKVEQQEQKEEEKDCPSNAVTDSISERGGHQEDSGNAEHEEAAETPEKEGEQGANLNSHHQGHDDRLHHPDDQQNHSVEDGEIEEGEITSDQEGGEEMEEEMQPSVAAGEDDADDIDLRFHHHNEDTNEEEDIEKVLRIDDDEGDFEGE